MQHLLGHTAQKEEPQIIKSAQFRQYFSILMKKHSKTLFRPREKSRIKRPPLFLYDEPIKSAG